MSPLADVSIAAKVAAVTAFRLSMEPAREDNDILAEVAIKKLLLIRPRHRLTSLRLALYYLIRSGTSDQKEHCRREAKGYSDELGLPQGEGPFEVFMRVSEKLTQITWESDPGRSKASMRINRAGQTTSRNTWRSWFDAQPQEFVDLAVTSSGLTELEFEEHASTIEGESLATIVVKHRLN